MFCCLAVTANAQDDTEAPFVESSEFVFTEAETGDTSHAVITLVFNEDVQHRPVAVTETKVIKEGVWTVYEIYEGDAIVVEGNVVTITPPLGFSASDRYELIVSGGAFQDAAGNVNAAYTEVFTTDENAPMLTEISPDLTQEVNSDASFSLSFSKHVTLVEAFGFYTYVWDEEVGEAGEFVELEQLDASQVTVEGNVVTFDPAMDLPVGQRAQIILTAGSVRDANGNAFLNALGGEDTLTFVSERFWVVEGAGEPTDITFTPADEDTLATAPESLTIAFNQDVVVHDTIDVETDGYGSLVYLRQGDVDLDYEATFDANVITIVPAEALAMDNAYTFGFTEGFLDSEGVDVAAQEATFVLGDAGTTDDYDAIADIRGENDESPMDGEEVTILGTVTGVYAEEGFYVQDDNAVRSGIWVSYAATEELEAGDGVIISGVVDSTAYGLTIIADEVTETDAPIAVEPLVVDFENDSIPSYNGVVVSFAGLRAAAANEAGDWNLFTENDMDSVLVSGQMFAYEWVAENLYDLTGVVTSRDSIYRVEPRTEADVTDVTNPTSVNPSLAADINVYPNPFTSYVRISNHEKINRVVVSNIAGQRVIDVRNPQAEISTSRLVSGVYIINLYKNNELVKSGRIVKQ